MTITSETDRVIGRLRQEVCDLHAQLTRYDLVIWTAGNVSARVPDRDLMVIKPSGADYDSLTADDIVVCDLHGHVVEGDLGFMGPSGSSWRCEPVRNEAGRRSKS